MKSKLQIANILSVLVILAMLIAPVSSVSFAAPADKAQPPQGDGPAAPAGETATSNSPTGLYIVRLQDASLSAYTGGVDGFEATSPIVTGSHYVDLSTSASAAYLDYLQGKHTQALAAMEQALGRSVEVRYQYLNVLNGMAVAMSAAEAVRVSKLPGVASVTPDKLEQMATDVGPTWIGAPAIWNGATIDGADTKGEGVIVAVLDSGINHDHPSFATTGEDGYTHTNPYGSGNSAPGSYCDITDPAFCTDKLVGAWDFHPTALGPEDTDGHGSHTSSTAAGNVVTSTLVAPTSSITATISGVAPHANIIMYKVCEPSCPSSSSVAAVNQAIADRSAAGGVPMALNFSISGSDDPWADSVDQAFLDAFNAGIYVSASAGNTGPGPSTVAHTGPWNATTAASTHNRALFEYLQGMTGGSTTPPADMQGAGFTAPYSSNLIVYAGDFGDPLCPTPFPAGTWTNGEIVICDRGGGIARVDKGANVLAGGAGGYILANDAASGDSLVADPHFLPAIHISFTDGVTLKTWVADGGSGHSGTISGTVVNYDAANGDHIASFSARGPSQFDVLEPDYTAPGVDVWAAYCCGVEYTFLGGTSMSSPHSAGSGALMLALHPTWSPAEVLSALKTTALTNPVPLTAGTANVVKEDGVTPADWFDMGSGRIALGGAAMAGLVLDETGANFAAADPDLGGDPRTLNVPSMQDWNCVGTCVFTRTVTSPLAYAVDWTATSEAPAGLTITVSPSTFTLPGGGSQEVVITVDTSSSPVAEWQFANVYLTPSEPVAAPSAPVSVETPSNPVQLVDAFATVTSADQCAQYANYAGSEPVGYAENCGNGATVTPTTGNSTLAPTDTGYAKDLRVSTGQNLTSFTLNDFPTQTVVGANARSTFALDFDPTGTTLYAIDNTSRELGTLSLVDATFAPIAILSGIPVTYTTSGLTIDPLSGAAYLAGLGDGAFHLYSFDLGTAVATPIGSDATVPLLIDIALGPQGVMYGHDIGTDGIYTIDTSTGVVTLVGITGVNSNFAQGMDFDNNDGTLYAFTYQGTGANVYGTIDLATGALTPLASSNPLGEFEGAIPTTVPPPPQTTYCSAPGVNIPDNNPAGVSDSIVIADASAIIDVNLTVTATHSWVGDLSFSLAHTDTATGVTAIDRPGYTGTGFGCSANDIAAMLDDEGTDGPVESQCSAAPPALFGNPTPNNPLSAFDGEANTGTWTLTASDAAAGDTGALGSWCVTFEYGTAYVDPATAHLAVAVFDPGSPTVAVTPDALVSEQGADQIITQTMTISNTGTGDLNWNVFEDADAPVSVTGVWADNFDSYPTGQDLHGVGGWKGWDNTPGSTALTSAAQALSAPNSVDISAGADLVHEYAGATSGLWTYTAWQYVPSTMTGGPSYFILLNTYSDGGTKNWSVQVSFDATANTVTNEGVSGGTLALVEDQWVELRVEIDLDNNTQDFYYDNQLLYSGTWTEEQAGGGALNVGAVDLFANSATSVFYDDMSLTAEVPPVPTTCDFPGNVPWLAVSPSSGTTSGPGADDVTVTFDSTGLSLGVYTGTLCVTSNDVTTPLVIVPVTMTLDTLPPVIEVSPSALANTQGPDVTTTWDLTISNTGEAALDWTIDEDAIPNVLYSTVTLPSTPAGTLGEGFSTSGKTGPSVAHTLRAPEGLTTITHSASQSITTGNSVSCNAGGLHTNNSYVRQFTLADFGITDPFDVTEVSFGVEQATGATGTQPVTVNLYTWNPSDPFTFANFTLVGTADAAVPDQTLSVYTVPVTGSIPAGGTLVVEVFTPEGQTAGNSFFIGSNADGQTSPSYLAAADCGITNPTDTAAIGFPNMMIVMNVTGEIVPAAGVCVNPEDVAWASVNPLSGTTAGGSASTVEVTFDSTGLAAGVYTGTLCVGSNDLTNPLVTVPLTLTVDLDADLALTKSAPATANVGDNFTYTLEVTNSGPATALDTTVIDTLPAGVTFVSATAGCTEAAGVVTCDLGDLASGGTATIEIVVTADEAGTVSNTAEVSSTSPDPDTTNNSDSADTDVVQQGFMIYLPIVSND